MLFISKDGAHRYGTSLVNAGAFAGYRVRRRHRFNPDRSLSIGYVVKFY